MAIEASSVRCKTLADGSLDVTLRIEPGDAVSAFRMLGVPGTPVALARLKTAPEKAADDKPKGGALAKLAGQWCADPTFWAWIKKTHGLVVDHEQASVWVRMVCMVDSRAEIDHRLDASTLFHARIREPFSAWLKANQ